MHDPLRYTLPVISHTLGFTTLGGHSTAAVASSLSPLVTNITLPDDFFVSAKLLMCNSSQAK